MLLESLDPGDKIQDWVTRFSQVAQQYVTTYV